MPLPDRFHPSRRALSAAAAVAAATGIATIAKISIFAAVASMPLLHDLPAGAGRSQAAPWDRADAEPDLAITLSAPTHAAPGGRLRYQLVVTNTGAVDAVDVVVTDTLPAEVGFDGASDDGSLVAPRKVRWALGDLGPGAARVLALAASVPPTATAGVAAPNTAVVRGTAEESNLGNNGAGWITQIQPVDLRVEIASAAADVRPGERVTHTITIHNVSRAAAEDVAVTVALGGGAIWEDDSSADDPTDPERAFTRTLVPGGVRWARDAAPGVWTGRIDLVTRIPLNAPPGSGIVHIAGVASRTRDDALENNVAASAPLPVVVPDLWVTKTGPAQAAAGAAITYTLAYGNRGPGAAPRARLTDTLPAGLAYVSALPPATVADARTLTWDVGIVPAGAEDRVLVQLRVGADQAAGASLTNQAVVAAGAPDRAPADNATSAATTVLAGAAARIILTAPGEAPAGVSGVEIAAEVRDAAGSLVGDGTPVTFETTHGQVQPPGGATRDGRVFAQWRPGTALGTATLTARSGGAAGRQEVKIVAGPPRTVTVRAEPATATAGQTVTLAVEVRDISGNPVADGTPVGIVAAEGTVAPVSVSTMGGSATASWRHTRAGTFGVTAQAGGRSGTVRVTVLPGVPAAVRLSVDPPELPVGDGRATVWAAVDDRFGNPVADGVRVSFAGDGGRFDPPQADTAGGQAAASFLAGPVVGSFSISATAGGTAGLATVTLKPADLVIASHIVGPRGPLPGAHVYPGDVVTYTVVVRNQGLATARQVRLGAVLEDRVAVGRVSGGVPVTPIAGGVANLPRAPAQQYARYAWALPDLKERDAITLALSTSILREPEPPWTGFDTLFYRAAITTTTAEASAGDLVRTEKVDVQAADLFVTAELDGAASSIRPGGVLAYDIAFGNGQAVPVAPVFITSTLPAWTVFDHWQPDQTEGLAEVGAFGPDARVLRWAFDGSFRLSQGIRLWLAIAPDAPPDALLEHLVEIGSAVPEVNRANNTAVAGGVRLQGVNLRAAVTAPSTAEPGERVAWQIAVTNGTTQSAATDVVVRAALSPQIAIARTDPPAVALPDGTLRWAIEQPLVAGAERRFEIEIVVPGSATAGTEYRVAVDTSSSQREAFPADNRAEAVTRVVPGAPAVLELGADRVEVAACSAETVQLTAAAADRAGNAVADGTPVRWSATAGTLSQAETPARGGRASVTLAAARAAGGATVTARAGTVQQALHVAMLAGPPALLTVRAVPETVGWDGEVEVTVDVADACDNPVADRWPVQLTAERGEWPNGGLALALPTSGGRVAATLRAGASTGPLKITAAHGEARGETTITVLDRPAPTATPAPRPGWRAYLPWMYRRAGGARRQGRP